MWCLRRDGVKVSLEQPYLAGPKFLAVLPVNCGVTAVSPILDVQLYYCGVVKMRCLAFEPELLAKNGKGKRNDHDCFGKKRLRSEYR